MRSVDIIKELRFLAHQILCGEETSKYDTAKRLRDLADELANQRVNQNDILDRISRLTSDVRLM